MITVPANPPFQTRVVVLDMNGKNRINLAILDAATLELEFLYRNGAAANEGSRAGPTRRNKQTTLPLAHSFLSTRMHSSKRSTRMPR
jgi:hypothetical protein